MGPARGHLDAVEAEQAEAVARHPPVGDVGPGAIVGREGPLGLEAGEEAEGQADEAGRAGGEAQGGGVHGLLHPRPGGDVPVDGAEGEAVARPGREDHPVRDEALAEVARLEVARDDDALAHEILRGEGEREARDDAPRPGLVPHVHAQVEQLVLARDARGRGR